MSKLSAEKLQKLPSKDSNKKRNDWKSHRSNRNRFSYRHCRKDIWEHGLPLTNLPATKKAMPSASIYASPMKLSASTTGYGMISRQSSLDVSLLRHPQTVIFQKLSNGR